MLPVLKEFGLNHSQYLILLILRYSHLSGNKIISTELAYLLGLERHSVSAIIETLNKEGLIKRKRSKKDRRMVYLNLSEKGRELMKNLHPKTIEKIAFSPELTDIDFDSLFLLLELLRDMAAEKNEQSPIIFKSAYEKLLLEGQEGFINMLNKEVSHD